MSFAERMMKKMGHVEGQALGAGREGALVAPIEADTSRMISSAGIGFFQAVSRRAHEYKAPEISTKIRVEFIPTQGLDESRIESATEAIKELIREAEQFEQKLGIPPIQSRPDLSTPAELARSTSYPPLSRAEQERYARAWDHPDYPLRKWAHEKRCQFEVIDERYARRDVQEDLLAAKSAFDTVADHAFVTARDRANPFELLKKEMFQNRAALKMAEMDSQTDHSFTLQPNLRKRVEPHPKYGYAFRSLYRALNVEEKNATAVCDNEVLYFGDVCAGPGGFTEYMLTVLKYRCKAFGFTLRGDCDFKVTKFNVAGPPDTFKAYYGPDNTGDVTNEDNMLDFAQRVWSETHGLGLHVVLADGGFSVTGKDNYQEFLSRQLVLCQCIAALITLRKGGVFVCKLFDNFLSFTVDCLYILRLAFEEVSLIKPNQSRPANSERYVFCRGLRERGGVESPFVQLLLRVNRRMNLIEPLDKLVRGLREFGLDYKHDARSEAARRGEQAQSFVAGETLFDESKDDIGADSESAQARSSNESRDLGHDSVFEAAREEDALMTVERFLPTSMVDEDLSFTDYITHLNNSYAESQIGALIRVKQYLEDPNLLPDDQEKIRLDCLKEWRLSPNGPAQPSSPGDYVPYDPEWRSKWFTPMPGPRDTLDRLCGRERTPTTLPLIKAMFASLAKTTASIYFDSNKLLQRMREHAKCNGMKANGFFVVTVPRMAERCFILNGPEYRGESYLLVCSLPTYMGQSDSAIVQPTVRLRVIPRLYQLPADTIIEGYRGATGCGIHAGTCRPMSEEGLKRALMLSAQHTITAAWGDASEATKVAVESAYGQNKGADSKQQAIQQQQRERERQRQFTQLMERLTSYDDDLVAFDAWSLPAPKFERLFETQPKLRDRNEELFRLLDTTRVHQIAWIRPFSLDSFMYNLKKAPPEQRFLKPGHTLYVFRGDGARPQVGFQMVSTGTLPPDVEHDTLLKTFNTFFYDPANHTTEPAVPVGPDAQRLVSDMEVLVGTQFDSACDQQSYSGDRRNDFASSSGGFGGGYGRGGGRAGGGHGGYRGNNMSYADRPQFQQQQQQQQQQSQGFHDQHSSASSIQQHHSRPGPVQMNRPPVSGPRPAMPTSFVPDEETL